MSKKTILLTCAGGSAPIYLAQKLRKKYNVVLVDASDDHAGRFLGLPYERIPFGTSPTFIRALERIIKKYKVDFIVPGADEELLPTAAVAKKAGISAVIPSDSFIKLCLDKSALMKSLAKEGISNLLPYTSISAVQYPAIAKPNSGRGSRQVHTISNKKELLGYLSLYGKKFSDLLVQPCIEGQEYTVSVLVNNRNKVVGIVPKKIILKRGITRAAVTERNKAIEAMCLKIVEQYDPKGPFNVQLMLFKGVPYVFEINPRLSTTAVLTEKAFGDEIDLFVRYFDKEKIQNAPKMKVPVYLYRYEENVFR